MCQTVAQVISQHAFCFRDSLKFVSCYILILKMTHFSDMSLSLSLLRFTRLQLQICSLYNHPGVSQYISPLPNSDPKTDSPMFKSCLLSRRRKEELSSPWSGLCAWNMPSFTSVGRCVQFSQRAHSQFSNGDGLRMNSWVLSASERGPAGRRRKRRTGCPNAKSTCWSVSGISTVCYRTGTTPRSDTVFGKSLVSHTGGMILTSGSPTVVQVYQRSENAGTLCGHTRCFSGKLSVVFLHPTFNLAYKKELNGKNSKSLKLLYSE